MQHDNQLNVLFVCSRNQWRSPTAEVLWRRHPGIAVRSGGVSTKARHFVSAADIAWAQIIFVMEEKHKTKLFAMYRQALITKKMYVLDIPDDYTFMDAELVVLLRQSVGAILGVL